MSPMAWWSIPVLATTAAAVWLRIGGMGSTRLPRRPEPGSAQDAADLARFADALARPLPDEAVPDEAMPEQPAGPAELAQ